MVVIRITDNSLVDPSQEENDMFQKRRKFRRKVKHGYDEGKAVCEQ